MRTLERVAVNAGELQSYIYRVHRNYGNEVRTMKNKLEKHEPTCIFCGKPANACICSDRKAIPHGSQPVRDVITFNSKAEIGKRFR